MKPKNVKLLALAACLTLSACASGMKPIPNPTVQPQANLLTACPPLPTLQPGENAVNNHIEAARLYHACSNKVRGWIDWYTWTEGAQ